MKTITGLTTQAKNRIDRETSRAIADYHTWNKEIYYHEIINDITNTTMPGETMTFELKARETDSGRPELIYFDAEDFLTEDISE